MILLPLFAGRRHQIFTWYVVVMVLVFLLPVPSSPLAESNQLDKLVHLGIFLGFALLFYLDRRPRVGWTLLISVAVAGAIELVQWVLPYREGNWWDFLAGAAGASMGILLVLLMERKAAPGAMESRQCGLDSEDQTAGSVTRDE